ncbi:MAG TPA: anti-sigma factor [Candidatus Kapabacteria bacterium]|jgi:anti-sigma factor RsiW|nr:anti-sigma factor [Candidatus Kapabacteria bacterium]
MNCTEVQDLAAALIDHESLGPKELAQVEAHLVTCPKCRYEYEMDRMTSRIVRARLPIVETPSDTYQSILSAIEED